MGRLIRCGLCNVEGHNVRTCPSKGSWKERDKKTQALRRAVSRRSKLRKMEEGRCVDCGKPRSPKSKRRCDVCLAKSAASTRRSALAAKEAQEA